MKVFIIWLATIIAWVVFIQLLVVVTGWDKYLSFQLVNFFSSVIFGAVSMLFCLDKWSDW